MIAWQGLTVLSIENIMLVPSVQGKHCIITNRPTYGLSFSYGGRITYTLNGARTVSDPSCAVFLPQGRSYRLLREESGEFPVINFTVKEDFTEDFIKIPLQNPSLYSKDLMELHAAWIGGNDPAGVMSIFYRILSHLAKEGERSDSHQILAPALNYLGQHLSDSTLSNKILADQTHVSEVYFRKLFRDAYGISPHQYILQARINRAKQLLSERSATVTAISESCGFSSVYHFCRAFKQITGMTPKDFEKNRSKK